MYYHTSQLVNRNPEDPLLTQKGEGGGLCVILYGCLYLALSYSKHNTVFDSCKQDNAQTTTHVNMYTGNTQQYHFHYSN